MDDRQILRDLARQVRDIADLPEMQTRKFRWRNHNALRPERPMVLCFPEGAWGEILTVKDLLCQDKRCRGWEHALRSRMHWWNHLRDDSFIEPWFDIGWQVNRGQFGVEIPFVHGDNRGSYHWDPPLKDLDADFPKLKIRQPTVNRAGTLADRDRANETFGDILPARIHGQFWWTTGLTWDAALLFGMENMMLAMYDQPEQLHRLMAFLRDDMLNFLAWAEREKLLTFTNGPDYTGSGGIAETVELPNAGDTANLSQRWGFAESQETVGISPTMFAEFVVPYQIPILEKFGLNCYGCCEQLEQRMDVVLKSVPRLRRVSVAPMANQEMMAAKLAGKYIFSRKPNPAHVCVGFNEQAIREDIRTTLRVAGQGPVELILKDTHTVENDPSRLSRWIAMAYEEIEKAE